MAHIRKDAAQKARSVALQYAFFRWESAAVIGGTLLLVFFLPRPFAAWPVWGWPILGALGLVAVVASSLTDPETQAEMALDFFRKAFDPGTLLDRALRQEMAGALNLLKRIEVHLRKQATGAWRGTLDGMAAQCADWCAAMYRVASRLDTYAQDPRLNQQRSAIPKELETLRARLKYENNANIRTQLEAVIESKLKQLESVHGLDTRLAAARDDLRESNRIMGQMIERAITFQAADMAGGQVDRLRHDINEEIARLQRLTLSIGEIYDYA